MNNQNTQQFDYNKLCCFYKSEYDRLVATGLYHGLGLEQVKDLIHQLFLHFAEKKIDLEAIENPKAYIGAAFKHRMADYYRTTSRRAACATPSCEAVSEAAIDQRIEQDETAAEISQQLKAAYQALPPRCRRVLFLKYYEGLSNDEIAARTGLSVRSVYNNVSEGIKQLRTAMAGQPLVANMTVFSLLLLLLCMGF